MFQESFMRKSDLILLLTLLFGSFQTAALPRDGHRISGEFSTSASCRNHFASRCTLQDVKHSTILTTKLCELHESAQMASDSDFGRLPFDCRGTRRRRRADQGRLIARFNGRNAAWRRIGFSASKITNA